MMQGQSLWVTIAGLSWEGFKRLNQTEPVQSKEEIQLTPRPLMELNLQGHIL